MQKLFLVFILFLHVLAGRAQPIIRFSGTEIRQDSSFHILPGRHYSFRQIIADPGLSFQPGDSIRPAISRVWWIRLVIENPSNYSQAVNISFFPYLNNTLWYFNHDLKTWNAVQSGFQVAGDSRKPNRLPLLLRAGARDTFFIRTDVSALSENYPVRLSMAISGAAVVRKLDDFQWIAWLVTIVTVLGFFIYNCFLYFSFKESTWRYYLLIQIGGVLYLTGAGYFFNLFIRSRYFTVKYIPESGIYTYHINNFLNHLGTMLVMLGFVQLTRRYLGTKSSLPRLDKLMQYLLWAFLAFGLATSILTFSGIIFLQHFSVLYYNIFTILIIVTILVTAFTAFFRRIRAARYYLIANLASLGLVLSLAVYVGFIQPFFSAQTLLGNIAILAQALLFSFALIERIGLIREELACRQLEAQELMHEIEEMQERNREIESENEHIQNQVRNEQSRNLEMQQKLAANQRELASATLYMAQKNELMAELKSQIRELNKLLPGHNQVLRKIESNLMNNEFLTGDWEKFRIHFEQVHPHFFENLKQKHPGLTRYETRLCAYFHLNLSTKEIAALLNIDPASVRRAKTRLNKKVAIADL